MKIERKKAQELVAKESLTLLSDEDVVNIITDYGEYENESEVREGIENGDLPLLNDKAILALCSFSSSSIPDREIFKPLLMDFQVFMLNKVQNSYLEEKLKGLGLDCTIEGKPEAAAACPCCEYLSISPGEEGAWEICTVCFWENGGDGPNHMALAEAKRNFVEFGAIDKRSLRFVDTEGSKKYARRIIKN